MKILAICLSLFLLAGCAARPARVQPAHASMRLAMPVSELGSIGVVSTSSVPYFAVQLPGLRSQIMSELAEKGMWLGIEDPKKRQYVEDHVVGYSPSAKLPDKFGLLLGAPMAVGGMTGAAIGSMQGVGQSEFKRAEAALGGVTQRLNRGGTGRFQERLRWAVHAQLAERLGGSAVLVASPVSDERRRGLTYPDVLYPSTLSGLPPSQTAAGYLTQHGIGTMLEIALTRYGLRGGASSNAPLRLEAEGQARLVRVRDGAVLAACPFSHASPKRTFTAWGARDAEPLRAELERCFATLAEHIVEGLLPTSASAEKLP